MGRQSLSRAAETPLVIHPITRTSNPIIIMLAFMIDLCQSQSAWSPSEVPAPSQGSSTLPWSTRETFRRSSCRQSPRSEPRMLSQILVQNLFDGALSRWCRPWTRFLPAPKVDFGWCASALSTALTASVFVPWSSSPNSLSHLYIYLSISTLKWSHQRNAPLAR